MTAGLQDIIAENKPAYKSKFSGCVMREDNVVATVASDEIVSIDKNAPIFLQRTRDFTQWLEDRGADIYRSYMRNILSHFGFPLMNILTAVKAVHAANITDTFWIKSETEDIGYLDVQYKDDIYAKAALQGDPDIFQLPLLATPEITNIGSFNKGWRKIGDKWVLYKAGKPLEIFSELFTSKLALALGLDAVEYYVDGEFIACGNFVESGWCFEPAKGIIGENTVLAENIDAFSKLGMLKEYMDIAFLDVLVRNGDRHEFNYGILTSRDEGVKIAPNFDNNMALFWNGIPTVLTREDALVSEFCSVINEAGYNLPDVTESLLGKVFEETMSEYPVSVDENTVIEFCMNAYMRIRNKA